MLIHDDQLKEYKSSIDAAKVVSFDIFDTLIHRYVYKPWHLFHMVSKSLYTSRLALNQPHVVTGLTTLRVTAESFAREISRQNRGTTEINLWDIYMVLTNMTGISNEEAIEIVKHELLLERAFVYKDPIMDVVYRYAKAMNKRVILCSDMYLPAKEIEQLLLSAGYAGSFEIYVSGEILKSKQDGNVFPYLFQQLDIRPEEMVHFGDNSIADFVKPREIGVTAFHLDYIEKNVNSKLRFPVDQSEYASSAVSLTQGINQYLMQHNPTDDFWVDIGRQVFGPLVMGHFIWLMNQLKNSSLEKVLFFARDGYLIEKLYQKYAGLFGVKIPSEYVYVSRASLFVPSFSDFDLNRMEYFCSVKAVLTVGQHLQRNGFSPFKYGNQIVNAGFSSMNDLVFGEDLRLIKLFSLLYDEILQASLSRGRITKSYLHRVIGQYRKIGVVEIGWRGRMQGAFSRIVRSIRQDANITGYYYGTFDTLWNQQQPNNHFESYLFHNGQPAHIVDHFHSGAVELLEFMLSAPHGTTLGYQINDDGSVVPLLEDNPSELSTRESAMKIQQGIMDFVEKALHISQLVKLDNLVTTDWAEPFYRLVRNPSIEEANVIGEITHAEALGDTVVRHPIAMKLNEDDRKNKFNDYYNYAYWKAGFLKRNS